MCCQHNTLNLWNHKGHNILFLFFFRFLLTLHSLSIELWHKRTCCMTKDDNVWFLISFMQQHYCTTLFWFKINVNMILRCFLKMACLLSPSFTHLLLVTSAKCVVDGFLGEIVKLLSDVSLHFSVGFLFIFHQFFNDAAFVFHFSFYFLRVFLFSAYYFDRSPELCLTQRSQDYTLSASTTTLNLCVPEVD